MFHDINQNGVQDNGEEDIPGWTMRIYSYPPGESPILVAEGVTDEQGNAYFDNLEPGRYKAWESERECWLATSNVGSWKEGFYKVFNLDADENKIISFGNYNSCERGTIIIEKKTRPDGATDSFTFSGDAAGTIRDGEQIVVSGLLPGTYTSQEALSDDWDLTYIRFDDDNSTGDVNSRTATFRLEAGETITAIFKNTIKNNPPYFTSPPVNDADDYKAYSYKAVAKDDDSGDVLTLWAHTIPSWLSFDPATGILSGTPKCDDVGQHNIILKASDGNEYTEQNFTITVGNNNSISVITSTPATSVNENVAYSYVFTATDEDEDDILTFYGLEIPSWLSFNSSSGLLSGTPGDDDVGEHSVALKVKDGINKVYQSFTINVINVNDSTNNKIEDDNSFEMYPNPALEILLVKINNSQDGEFILEIINTNGTVVYHENILSEKQIDLSGFTKGLYFVKLSGTDIRKIKKLIIQ